MVVALRRHPHPQGHCPRGCDSSLLSLGTIVWQSAHSITLTLTREQAMHVLILLLLLQGLSKRPFLGTISFADLSNNNNSSSNNNHNGNHNGNHIGNNNNNNKDKDNSSNSYSGTSGSHRKLCLEVLHCRALTPVAARECLRDEPVLELVIKDFREPRL
jgi:hypothetical protein